MVPRLLDGFRHLPSGPDPGALGPGCPGRRQGPLGAPRPTSEGPDGPGRRGRPPGLRRPGKLHLPEYQCLEPLPDAEGRRGLSGRLREGLSEVRAPAPAQRHGRDPGAGPRPARPTAGGDGDLRPRQQDRCAPFRDPCPVRPRRTGRAPLPFAARPNGGLRAVQLPDPAPRSAAGTRRDRPSRVLIPPRPEGLQELGQHHPSGGQRDLHLQ